MHLVEILLPTRDNDGNPYPDTMFSRIKDLLTAKFGGLTAFTRVPAEGIWRGPEGASHDDIVVINIIARDLDKDWWRSFKRDLENHLRQDEIVVFAHVIDVL